MRELTKAIYAGIAISLGGYVYLTVENKYLGALLFAIGLSAVLIFNFNLFTGKVCYRDSYRNPVMIGIILIGNYIGSTLCGLILSQHNSLYETARLVSISKMEKLPLSIFIDSIICGICIAIAVKGYRSQAPDFMRCLIVILGVMVFILCGAEHVVADMFYFAGAKMISLETIMFLIIVTVGNTLGGVLFTFV